MMFNTSLNMPMSTRSQILDEFAQKMVNSGHSVQQRRRNILIGVKGYESKLKKCAQNNTPINRSVAGSGASRRKTKLTGKTDCFRKPLDPSDPDGDLPHNICHGEGGEAPQNKLKKKKNLPPPSQHKAAE